MNKTNDINKSSNKTCIICNNTANSREHIFPAAFGGRVVNKSIYCSFHNCAYSRHVDSLDKELDILNSAIGVIPDRKKSIKETRLKDSTSEEYVYTKDYMKLASPSALDMAPNSDERFKYIYQENQERSAARNHGLDVARGEYIQFLDSDDEIYPTKIEKQVNFLDANPEYFLVYCGVEYKNELGQVTHTLEPKIDGNIDYEILKGNFLVIHSPLFRKTDIRFDVKINRLEDWKFWIYVIQNKKIAYIDEILCDVYIKKQLSKKYILKMLQGDINIYSELLKNAQFRKYKFSLTFLKLKKYMQYFYHFFKSGN